MKTNYPPLPLENGALYIDNSGWIEGLMNCETLVSWKQLYKRVPSGDKPALSFGSAIHLGLEYRYVKHQNRPVDEAYYNSLVPLLTDHFAKFPTPEGDFRTLNWAVELLHRYNMKYSIEEFNLLKLDNPITCPYCNGNSSPCVWCSNTGKRDILVEVPFSVPLFTWTPPSHLSVPAIPVIFTGKIDLPLIIDNKIYVMDHKTTSMLGATFWDDKKASSQFKGYAWAFLQATGKLPHGYAVNAIRTKAPPLYVSENKVNKRGVTTSPEQWWNESLSRERFPLHPEDIDEWYTNTTALVSLFLLQYFSNMQLPRRTTNCISKYGHCPYFEVCHTYPIADRLLMIQSGEFMDNTWSPLSGNSSQAKQ